ncbi:hypothetical protein [Winogradskyella eximia]|uniref:hypothetical protein n=1 Tax=Winogradskyella eximia TaxID=262006 RepID=UPI0024924143|nr:hypothetical protein [Winogradskyella eximia]
MIILTIIGIYVVYVLLIGILFFSFKYYKTEKKIINTKEFALLVLFPIVGYGNWLYKKELREKGITKFPKEWFIWKNAIPINIGYIILLAIIGYILFGISTGSIGGGMEWANKQENAALIGVGFLTDIVSGIALLFITIIAILGLGMLAFFLIFIPIIQVKSIERIYYKKQVELNNSK